MQLITVYGVRELIPVPNLAPSKGICSNIYCEIGSKKVTRIQHRTAFGFENLRKIHGRVYSTYQEAATALGLSEDESEAVRAMRGAAVALSRAGQLRFLLAHLLQQSDESYGTFHVWHSRR